MTTFKCSTCDEEHDLSDITFGADVPAQWDMLTDADRENSELSSDQCIIRSAEGTYFLVRACLDIPIVDEDCVFTWGVWVSLSEASFLDMSGLWQDPRRINTRPYFGWLCTRIPGYPDSMYLKASVHQRCVGERPAIELEPTDHPLARDQRLGIEKSRIAQVVQRLLHKSQPD